MYNFSSYIRISPELLSLRAPAASETRSYKGFQWRKRTPHAREVPTIAVTMVNMWECAFVVVFGSPLFCAGERCADLCVVVVVFEGQFFLKNSARHRASVDEKKNRMRRHTIFHSYCCYYRHYYYRMTTAVTTAATQHGITTLLYYIG